jgi:hypothetical protein
MNEISEVPKYLYHYTNINSLALILQSKKFLFSSLPDLDDLEEGLIKDRQKWTKYCFVSSWTSQIKEDIPMWKMYCNDLKGVRIRLPSNLFPIYEITSPQVEDQLAKMGSINLSKKPDDKLGDAPIESPKIWFRSPVPIEEFFNEQYSFLSSSFKGVELVKVNYTDEEDDILQKIGSISGELLEVALGKLGKAKRSHWDFQKEWRYIVRILPVPFRQTFPFLPGFNKDFMSAAIELCLNLPFSNYLMCVDEKKFEDMEITLGPKANEGDRAMVELLINEYNPSASWKYSDLKDKIR